MLWFIAGMSIIITQIAAKLIIWYQIRKRVHLAIHIQTGTKRQNGFSHRIRRLGAVASWLDMKTRNARRHPVSPNAVKSRASNHLVTARRRLSCHVNASAIINRSENAARGVRNQGVGASVASAPGESIFVPETICRLSTAAKCIMRIRRSGANAASWFVIG